MQKWGGGSVLAAARLYSLCAKGEGLLEQANCPATSSGVSGLGAATQRQAKAAIRLHNITKTFGSVRAVHRVNLEVRSGEILALLGENGSGKTTLMNILAGIYFPDEGQLLAGGKEVVIRSPKDAFSLGIGMIHQHFKLVDVFTAAENIVLGLPGPLHINRRSLAAELRTLAGQYGFSLDPNKKVYDMSVSERQTVEIVKVLYRGVNTLILDEPTAVLTPQEADRLFAILRNMKTGGKSIILITHKLQEVLAVSDRVAVLRKGECVGTLRTENATLQSLTEALVGRTVSLSIERPRSEAVQDRLVVQNLCCRTASGLPALQNVSFTLKCGEILGIAGIAGSGQKELCEALCGLYPVQSGSIRFIGAGGDTELANLSPSEIQAAGIRIGFVPEDRLGMGLAPGLSVADNMMLKNYRASKGPLVDRKSPRLLAEQLIARLDISTPGPHVPVRRLSGGNVQKVLLGREIESAPALLVAAYPVRGLDIHSSYTVYELLNRQKQQGAAVLFVGEDLDVLLELCDRLLVLCSGQVSGLLDARRAAKHEVGLLMTQAPPSSASGEVRA